MNGLIPNNYKAIAAVLSFVFLLGLITIGCEKNDPSEPRTGDLQVAFAVPGDIAAVQVDLYLGDYRSGDPLESRVLEPDGLVTLFENLTADDDYYVTAEAWDAGDDMVVYSGVAAVSPKRDVTKMLTMLLHQSYLNIATYNDAPRILAVEMDGPAVSAAEMNPNADPKVYVAAPKENESITLTVAAADQDADDLTFTWSVKDGPSPMDQDVGTVTQSDSTSVEWSHDVAGEYYAHIEVKDDRGGVSYFTFNLFVWDGTSVMEPSLKFNSLPSIALDAYVMMYGELPDFSDALIMLAASTWDPDGNPVTSTHWTEDCAAHLADGSQSARSLLIPMGKEECATAFTACDSIGCNQSAMDLSISCTTLSPGFDATEPGSFPINNCFNPPPCDPTAPHAPNYPGECVTNDWECGVGFDGCNYLDFCGTCPDAGVCEDHVCIPNGDL